jgi:glyoxylase-like metal-dependent hydrolase (beta-lactamase superfamily II)
VTFGLPFQLDHVHAYLVPTSGGGWMAVDTGLGLPGVRERWEAELGGRQLDRIFVTHYHPDHIGGAAELADLTGAAVLEGRLDYEQAVDAWGRAGFRSEPYMRAHGYPEAVIAAIDRHHEALTQLVHFVEEPEHVEAGATLDGWSVLAVPGHADGHLALLRDGVMIGGDVLLAGITPNISLWPHSRRDTLRAFLDTLDLICELRPRIVLPGHNEPIADPARRAAETREHHELRLAAALDALSSEPRSGYDVSLTLFPAELDPPARRMATGETLAHLEYLVDEGAVVRSEDGGRIAYSTTE